MQLRILVFIILTANYAYTIDINEILDQSDKVMHPENLQGSFTMTLTSKGGDKRIIKVTAYQKKKSNEREDRLFIFTFPPSVKGTGLLVRSSLVQDDNNMWIYLPAVGKIKRVNLSASGGGYFMGSDFTYSDLISQTRKDFNYLIKGDEKINGEECYVLEVRGKNKNIQKKYGYSRQLYYTRKSDYVNIKIIFFDMAGDLLKELSIKKVAVFGDYLYPSYIIMENKQSGHTSEIVFDQLSSPNDIPDKYFTHRYLKNQ